MNNKILWGIVIIIILGIGGWYYSKPKAFQKVEGVGSSVSVPEAGNQPSETAVQNISVKEFIVGGKDFSFSPSAITVNKGDRVKIALKNTQGFHDLRIEGYDIGTEKIQTGGESFVEFVADKTGSFEYYCSVGGHRAKGMRGTFVVQ